jgi:nitrogen-specific signal transduction histidine kinase/CheY-like chemotaxis protein
MKDNLARLGPAIVRELREAQTRRERTQLEEQVRQAQRLDAVGRLAGGVAHDFNNMLTVIEGRSQFLLNRLTPQDPARREATLILEAARRAATLTRQLLAFSRGQLLQTRALSLNAVVAGMEFMLRRLIGERIALSTVPDPALGTVMADQGHLEQVIMNLAVNARDAMAGGGQLTIKTANVELDEAYCRSRVDARPGPYVALSVTDTGIGMDAAIQAQLFEPFFTTKGAKGTGLGLSVVYGIVKQSGGFISVASEPGRGATLTIYLPRVKAPVQAPAPEPAFTETIGGSETILLVEDQAEVLTVMADILRNDGYVVIEASNGTEALEVAERHRGEIHLLVTDVVMPRIGGRELVRRLRPQRPDIRVLYVSGYTDESITDSGVVDADFLEKPLTVAGLTRKVRQVLNAPAG